MQYAKIGFLIASIAMFPLEMIPCKNSIEELFFKENKMTYDSALVRYTKLHKEQVAVHCPFQFIQSEGYSDIEDMRRPVR